MQMTFSKAYLKAQSLQAITISVFGFPLLWGKVSILFLLLLFLFCITGSISYIQSLLVSSVIKISC